MYTVIMLSLIPKTIAEWENAIFNRTGYSFTWLFMRDVKLKPEIFPNTLQGYKEAIQKSQWVLTDYTHEQAETIKTLCIEDGRTLLVDIGSDRRKIEKMSFWLFVCQNKKQSLNHFKRLLFCVIHACLVWSSKNERAHHYYWYLFRETIKFPPYGVLHIAHPAYSR